MNLQEARALREGRQPGGKGTTGTPGHEEILAYDAGAYGGVGAFVVISEGIRPGSGVFTVFKIRPRGAKGSLGSLSHVMGSPEGPLEICRAWVAKRVAEGRYEDVSDDSDDNR